LASSAPDASIAFVFTRPRVSSLSVLHVLQRQAAASGITPSLLASNPAFVGQSASDQLDTILNGVFRPAGVPQVGNGGNVETGSLLADDAKPLVAAFLLQ